MRNINFKDDIAIKDLAGLTDNCWVLLDDFINWCKIYKLSCTITSLKSDRININSKSTTHEDGRAFDVRVGNDWEDDYIESCLLYFNEKYKNIGALSLSDQKSRAVIHHNSGHGSHFHFQVKR